MKLLQVFSLPQSGCRLTAPSSEGALVRSKTERKTVICTTATSYRAQMPDTVCTEVTHWLSALPT